MPLLGVMLPLPIGKLANVQFGVALFAFAQFSFGRASIAMSSDLSLVLRSESLLQTAAPGPAPQQRGDNDDGCDDDNGDDPCCSRHVFHSL